jgi:hypothetical protein
MDRPAENEVSSVLADQMRTDELRELLERYPALGAHEMTRLRELYVQASATEVMAVRSSSDLARKAARLESSEGITAPRLLLVACATASLLLATYTAMQP